MKVAFKRKIDYNTMFDNKKYEEIYINLLKYLKLYER